MNIIQTEMRKATYSQFACTQPEKQALSSRNKSIILRASSQAHSQQPTILIKPTPEQQPVQS